IAEQQQSKYLDLYTILPSEISMQLAEVTLTLGSLEEQVPQTALYWLGKLLIISVKLKEKAPEISQAKEETKALKEELESCGRSLSELDAAVQEFGEQNPTLSKQLKDAITKLKEIHHHTGRLADYRTARLKKAASHVHEFSEMLEFVMAWTERAEAVVKDSLIWSSSSQLQDQINTYQVGPTGITFLKNLLY
uniref:Uncharacterized protein n=1 Tax=Paramormyrops kingsleyae TaxID=1676925 RepID=A0A3B3SYU4_9TELE